MGDLQRRSLFGTYDAAIGRVLAPRAHLSTTAPAISLNGRWQFRFRTEAANDDFSLPPTHTPKWAEVTVPSHWALRDGGGYSHPWYTNLTYPIPVAPPHVPAHNPTGEYRREFVLDPDWPVEASTVLRFLGVESHAQVWLNGVWVAAFLGSRLTHELDVTDLLRRGRNMLAVRVSQWSPGTYLEDQDQWWLPGIFRDVELLHRPAAGIQDAFVIADYDSTSGRGYLQVHAESTEPIQILAPELGIDQLLTQEQICVGEVECWWDERPRRYTVQLSTPAETICLPIGFRRIEVVDGQLRANGRKLNLRGVNRHEFDCHTGRVFDLVKARADLELMKAFNINAIRTSHYPPHPQLLDLADELGLWVMVEADYETHGFELQDWQDNPSDDPRWRAAVFDRVARTFHRDKNHPAIFSWSLGNESGDGINLSQAAGWLRQVDPSRIIHYEADYRGAYTDIYSRMYPAYEEVTAVLDGQGPVAAAWHPAAAINAADAGQVRSMPYVMCEYLHAMGTGPGGIDGYIQAMDHPRHAGGFAWEWRDHAIEVDGHLLYGGDFGETEHDGNFVCDGLVDAYGRPSAGLVALANATAPVIATWQPGRATIVNRGHYLSTAALVLVWQTATESGQVPLPEIAAGACADVSIDIQVDQQVTLAICDRRIPGIPAREPREMVDGRPALPGVGECDDAYGRVMSIRTQLVGTIATPECTGNALTAPLDYTVWRASTDNDEGHGPADYWDVDPAHNLGAGCGQRGPSSADRWREWGLDRWRAVVISHSTQVAGSTRVLHGDVDGRCAATITENRHGNHIEVCWKLSGPWPQAVARQGLVIELPVDLQQARWLGLGPTENYPDLTAGVHLGVFQASIDRLWAPQVRPQEAGHRGQTYWLELTGPTENYRFVFAQTPHGLPGFSLSRWSLDSLSRAEHTHELPAPEGLWLHLDAFQHGIGSRSCGPDVRPEYAGRPQDVTITFSAAVLPAAQHVPKNVRGGIA